MINIKSRKPHPSRPVAFRVLQDWRGDITIQSRVGSRYEWKTVVKAKGCPGLGARTVRLES